MAADVNTTVSFPKWPNESGPFTTQAQLDECAEELWTTHHVASNMMRGWDAEGDYRRLQIHNADGVTGANAEIGTILILFNGAVEDLTPEEYASRGYGE